MTSRMPQTSHSHRLARWLVPCAVFLFTVLIRVRGVTANFWLLGDQVRDWGIALRPFTDLPLVGPPTHFDGYTIGPAYYWLMWAVRVVVGPWFDNLPHAGGIGQAIFESAADALLLMAVWRRTQSVWVALASVIVIATASYDVALAAIVWTTVIASALGKVAMALTLMEWHRRGLARVAVIAGLAWCAVHVYTGGVFVTVGVFAALLLDPIGRGDWRGARRTAVVIALSVVALQIPYVLHQFQTGFSGRAMGAVSGGIWDILTGRASPAVAKSLQGYAGAFTFIEVSPWQTNAPLWLLAACCCVAAVRHRRDPVLLALLLLPQAAALAGYAMFLGALDHYYYISVMPPGVLSMFFAVSLPSRTRMGLVVGVALLVAAVALVPARLRFAASMHKMPEYSALVDASRTLVARGQPIRAIRTEFELPPSSDAAFIFTILGGRLQPDAAWVATIARNGTVRYDQTETAEPRPIGP